MSQEITAYQLNGNWDMQVLNKLEAWVNVMKAWLYYASIEKERLKFQFIYIVQKGTSHCKVQTE